MSTLAQYIKETALECDYIYVAYSKKANLFKIGITKSPKSRIANMRYQAPALVNDWMYHWIKRVGCVTAMNHEIAIHRLLKRYQEHHPHLRRDEASKELFRCDIKLVKQAFKDIGITIPVASDALPREFKPFVPTMDYLMWVNMMRKDCGLMPLTKQELKDSIFYEIPEEVDL